MKKIIIIGLLFLLVGCSNINKLDYDQIINQALNSKNKLTNQYRTGYKYYLPSGIRVEDKTDFNEKFSSLNTNYYFFMDFVGYYNKKKVNYTVNEKALYSAPINHKDKFGYIEIREDRNKFYIEMMYNYAKIEVVSNKEELNNVIYRSIVLLSSIQYNDKTIAKFIGDDVLNFKEEQYNIFEPKENTTNFIDYVENQNTNDKNNNVPDYDLIK